MELLKIKNFGPINKANLKLKKVVLLIGPQSSGKSAISKLISILRDLMFIAERNTFEEMLSRYGIESYLNESTEIEYSSSTYTFKFKDGIPNLNHKGQPFLDQLRSTDENTVSEEKLRFYEEKQIYVQKALAEARLKLESVFKSDSQVEKDAIWKTLEELEGITNEITEFAKIREDFEIKAKEIINYSKFSKYIPSERNLYSILSNTKFSFGDYNIPFPKSIQNFGSIIEEALLSVKSLKVDFLSVEFNYSDEKPSIKDLNGSNEYSLANASSGLQSLIPLMIIMECFSKKSLSQTFVVEEPEMNLFPEAQYALIK